MGRMTSRVLEAVRPHAEQEIFYVWDPLAAVYLVHPNVVSLERFPVSVQPSGPMRAPPESPTQDVSFR